MNVLGMLEEGVSGWLVGGWETGQYIWGLCIY